jgi:3-amino-5-hydroxybenzoate synthase
MDGIAAVIGDGVSLIQDAAHAHGARWDGRRVGELGTMACFSFQNGKLMTAGEGGAVTFPTPELREQAFVMHNCGRPATDRFYRHEVASSNFRLGEFAGAVLRAQLRRLDQQTRLRERRQARLDGMLAELGVIPQGRDPRCEVHPHYMVMFRLDGSPADRDAVVDALVAEGVPAYVNYPPVYHPPAFWLGPRPEGDAAHWAARCPNAEEIGRRGIWLHHRVLLGEDSDLDDVVMALDKVLTRLGG